MINEAKRRKEVGEAAFPPATPAKPAPPALRGLSPKGAHPSTVIDKLPTMRSAIGPAVHHALDQISRVHGVPETFDHLPEIKTSRSGNKYASFGYRLDAERGEKPVDISVRTPTIRPEKAHPALSFIHEFGHYFEQQIGIGATGKGKRLSGQKDHESTPQAKALFAAIEGSKNLQAIKKAPRGRGAYYARKTEMFARAYSQWITHKTQSPSLIQELDIVRNNTTDSSGLTKLSQWSDDDFAPISQAFDDYFRSEGLIGE